MFAAHSYVLAGGIIIQPRLLVSGCDKIFDTCADIDVLSNLRKYKVNSDSMRYMAEQVLSSQTRRTCGLSISLVSRAKIKQLNQTYRHISKPTDVLAFPQELTVEEGGQSMQVMGDVVICPDVASGNAKRNGQGLDREVSFLLVHGILHLCGYDHQTESDAAIMFAQQRRMMDIFDRRGSWFNCIRSDVNGGS
ncbi:MAG: rRNA maturation RNase YbeY [Pseudomonadota bacterium]|nr:rRNA maturation RNase YbeY [Pseudomonadota bacterium]